MPKRRGDSFSRELILRILRILFENGSLKKTHLAGKARINYGMCIKYLRFLQKLEWIEMVHSNDSSGFVSITSEGVANLRKLKNEEKDKAVTSQHITLHNRDAESLSPSPLPEDAVGQQHPKYRKIKKIVIIDDDEDVLLTYKLFLDNGNFKVKTFSDPTKAFEFLTLHPKSYDVIVLDIRMPKMSGLRLYQGIKASNPNAKVIFLSSLDASPELTEIFPEIRKSQLLQKPVSRDDFLEAIFTTDS